MLAGYKFGRILILSILYAYKDPGIKTPPFVDSRNKSLTNMTRVRTLLLFTDRWRKVNFSPVCFGAKNHQFGRFRVRSGGRLATVKLVHLYGYVTCDTRHISYWSYWGCGSYYSGDKINVVITTASNHVLLPPGQFIVHHGAKWSKLPGYTSVSPELVLSFFHPYSVHSGQELRLWYGEDLMNAGEADNGGRACVDIYALYV